MPHRYYRSFQDYILGVSIHTTINFYQTKFGMIIFSNEALIEAYKHRKFNI